MLDTVEAIAIPTAGKPHEPGVYFNLADGQLRSAPDEEWRSRLRRETAWH